MSSKYYEWLARNEKPEEKRELTPKEKRRNWWDYHKWHVAAAVALVLFAAFVVRDVMRNKRDVPDYQIAYVGSTYLSEETLASLEDALAQLGEDLSGNGLVEVTVNHYQVADQVAGYAGQIQLTTDVETNKSFIFLMDDPAGFQEKFGLLAYPDGTLPPEGETPSEELWYSWTECPVLAGLETDQEALSGMYIACRGAWEKFDELEAYRAFWEKLTQGAGT